MDEYDAGMSNLPQLTYYLNTESNIMQYSENPSRMRRKNKATVNFKTGHVDIIDSAVIISSQARQYKTVSYVVETSSFETYSGFTFPS